MAFTAMFAQKSAADKALAATNRMDKNLDLSDEQKEKVRAAYLEVFIETDELNKGDKATRSARQLAVQSKFDTDLAQILTPEQARKRNSNRNHRPSPNAGMNKRQMKQSRSNPKDRMVSSSNRTADRMAKQLELSEKQRDQVFEAHQKKLTEVQTLRNNKTDRSEMVQAKKRINKEYQSKVDNILTAEQIEQRETIRTKRMQRNNNKLEKGPGKKMEIEPRKPNRKDNKGEMRMENQAALYTERMTEKLSLTKDQIDPFHQAFLSRISAVKSRKQQVTSGESAKGRREIMEAYRTKLEKILTPEQLTKLDALNNNKKSSKRG